MKHIPHTIVIVVALVCAFAIVNVSFVDTVNAGETREWWRYWILGGGLIEYLYDYFSADEPSNPNIEDTEEAIHHSFMVNRLNEINNDYFRSIVEERNYHNLYDMTYLSQVRFAENQVPEVLQYSTWDEALTHMDAFTSYDDFCRSVLLCLMGIVGYSDSYVLSYLAEADDKGFCDLYQEGSPVNFNDYGIALIDNTYGGTYLGDYYLNFVVLDTGESVTVDGTVYTATGGVPRVVTFNSANLDEIIEGDGELKSYTISAVSSASDVYINGVKVDYALNLFSDDEPVPVSVTLADWDDVDVGDDEGTSCLIDFETVGTSNYSEISDNNSLSSPNSFMLKGYDEFPTDLNGQCWWNLIENYDSVDTINFSFVLHHTGSNTHFWITFYDDSNYQVIRLYIQPGSPYSFKFFNSSASSYQTVASSLSDDTRYYVSINYLGSNFFNIQVLNSAFVVVGNLNSIGGSGSYTNFSKIYLKTTQDSTTGFFNYMYLDDLKITGSAIGGDSSFDYFTRLEGSDNITLDYDSESDIVVTDVLTGRANYTYFNQWHDSFEDIYDAMYDAGYALWTTFKDLGYNSSSEVPSNLTIPYPDWLMNNLQALHGINQSEFLFLYYNLLAQMNNSILWVSENIQGSSFNITNNFADYMINATLKRANDSVVFDNHTVWMSVLKEDMLLEKGETYTLEQQVLFYDLMDHSFYFGYIGDNLTIWNISYKGDEIDNYTMNITTLDIFASATYGVDIDDSFQADLAYLMSLLFSDNMIILYVGIGLIAVGFIVGVKGKKDSGLRTISKLLIVFGVILCVVGLVMPFLTDLWDSLFGWWPF